MNAAVLLPHTRLYGGVKRFFELGAALVGLGHSFTVFTPDGAPPDWWSGALEVRPFREIAGAALDVLFFTEQRYAPLALESGARYKVFYHVRTGDRVGKLVKHREIHVFACSTNIYEHDLFWYGVAPHLAVGGVDCTRYRPVERAPRGPAEPFVVMAYGRLAERRKGTRLVVAACERLYRRHPNLQLLLFDTPVHEGMRRRIAEFQTSVPHEFVVGHPVERNAELFHRADVFVAAEKNAGWANTVAEAMAAGVPVIATRSGTLDLVRHERTGLVVPRRVRGIEKAIERMLLAPPAFRASLASNARRHVERYDWQRLAQAFAGWHARMARVDAPGPLERGTRRDRGLVIGRQPMEV